MIKIVITGALGRMGSNNIRYLIAHKDKFQLVGATESSDCPYLGEDVGEVLGVGKLGVTLDDELEDVIEQGDVVIDFLFPEPSLKNVEIARKYKTPIVIGTTGFSKEQISKIEDASKEIPIVLASNMSVGVNLLLKLVEEAARVLGSSYDVEIVEMHHRHKKDAPSGTALSLAKSVASGLAIELDSNIIFGRQGFTGERGKEIAVHALRGGDVVGEHNVIFATTGERIEFVHKASSRDTFSQGAFRAAEWIYKRDAGLYSMRDVLGL